MRLPKDENRQSSRKPNRQLSEDTSHGYSWALHKAPLPDWMKDRSLLPKKPPKAAKDKG